MYIGGSPCTFVARSPLFCLQRPNPNLVCKPHVSFVRALGNAPMTMDGYSRSDPAPIQRAGGIYLFFPHKRQDFVFVVASCVCFVCLVMLLLLVRITAVFMSRRTCLGSLVQFCGCRLPLSFRLFLPCSAHPRLPSCLVSPCVVWFLLPRGQFSGIGFPRCTLLRRSTCPCLSLHPTRKVSCPCHASVILVCDTRVFSLLFFVRHRILLFDGSWFLQKPEASVIPPATQSKHSGPNNPPQIPTQTF